jgi:2-hydroxy-6-oxonona-2,4-dienedioate hydrolase
LEPVLPPMSAKVTPDAPLQGFASRTVTVVGPSGEPTPMDVQELGQGRRVVFLHGLVGLNEHWEEVVRRIAHRCRCVLVQMPLLQLRGEDCSIDGATDLAWRLLAQTEEPSILVGNSFGGHVAARLAIEQPHLVSGLVLAGSSGLIEKSMVSDIQIRPSKEWLRRKIGELFHDPSFMREADLDRAHAELSDRGGARAMVKLSRTARRNHLGPKLTSILKPTLLIWGKQDIVTPPEAAHEFMAKLPDARIVWLDPCGHAPMIEKPDEFAEAVLKFAEELDQREGRA